MKNTTSIKDISQAITHLSTRMDEKFDNMDARFEEALDVMSDFSTRVDERFEGVDQRLDGVDQRLDHLDSEVTKIGAVMVTKNYLDDKLADLRGDLIALARKTNRKLSTLVEELVKKGSLSAQVAKKILAMEPFLQ